MKNHLISTLAMSLIAMASTVAQADMVKPAGGILVNSAGMTVYTFDKDVAGSGKSTCNGPCLVAWPAVMAAADAKPEGNMTLVTRDDGAKQWAYKDKPLYTFARDEAGKPGTGEVVPKWKLAK